MSGTAEEQLSLATVRADGAYFEDVVALAKRHRDTLGFLPDTAFRDRAELGRLLAIVSTSRGLLAYALFDLTRRRVRLVQLCVSPSARGLGLARWLVRTISQGYREQLGIILKCRRDCSASKMWPTLGFTPLGDVPGRGAEGKPLTIWWLGHGHADLFSELLTDAPQLLAAIDSNVFLDLYDRDRSGFEESRSLLADWLPTHLSIAVTSQVQVELNNLEDGPSRRAQQNALSAYQILNPLHDVVERLHAELLNEVSPKDIERDPSLVDDSRHVAAAASVGAAVFITRDSSALTTLRMPALDLFGLHMLRPSEVVVHLDALANSVAYRPRDLLRTGYSLAEVGAGEEEHITSAFLNRSKGERKADFLRLWRSTSEPAGPWQRQVLKGPEGTYESLLVSKKVGSEYLVRFLRVSGGTLANTISLQALALLRRQSVTVGATMVRIDDPAPSEIVENAASADGFLRRSTELLAATANMCSPASDVIAWARATLPPALAAQVTDLSDQLRDGRTASTVERYWWPLKVSDAELPVFVVPIDPVWSYELFGYPEGLVARADQLGLSREHVYYRSSRPQIMPNGPARVLWYASGKGRARVGAVIACSRVVEVVQGRPEDLYRRFNHLGVWRLQHIRGATKTGVATAIRFSDTELFRNTISYRRMKELTEDCQTGTLQSPTRITAESFARIYVEGRGL